MSTTLLGVLLSFNFLDVLFSLPAVLAGIFTLVYFAKLIMENYLKYAISLTTVASFYYLMWRIYQ